MYEVPLGELSKSVATFTNPHLDMDVRFIVTLSSIALTSTYCQSHGIHSMAFQNHQSKTHSYPLKCQSAPSSNRDNLLYCYKIHV